MRKPGLAVVVTALLVASTASAAPVTEEAVMAVASQLRCVVCQNLSVADSPSEMARQMREVIRERLAQGETPQQVIDYFEGRYGQWVLLSPKFKGFTLIVWVLPFAGLVLGVGVVLLAVRRWARRPDKPPDPLAPADRERVRLEVERLGD